MGNLHTVGHIFNPLTTDDAFWHCLTLAVCYRLVQGVLKIGFVLAKMWDRGRWGDFNTGWLPWLAVEQLWSALAGSFLNTLAQMDIKTTHLLL